MLLGYRVIPRQVLLDSYQHQLLAAATGLLLCLTPVPSLGAFVFICVQLWRVMTLRRAALPAPVFDERADLHRRGYFATSGAVSKWLGVSLLCGLLAQYLVEGSAGLELARAFTALALALALRALLRAYRVVKRDLGYL